MAERKCFTTKTIANQALHSLKRPYRWDCFSKQQVLVRYKLILSLEFVSNVFDVISRMRTFH